MLHEATGTRVTHRFGDTVTAVDTVPTADGGTEVRVEFRAHEPEMFDLVVGADGAHSVVRALVFGPEERFRRPLGLAHAWFTLAEEPATPRLDGWFLVHNAPGRRVVEARPGHSGTQEVGLTFPATTLPPRKERAARLALLDDAFADVGWRAREIVSAAGAAPDFALDTFDQVHMPQWHQGRVVLLGDSAWCASPLSGLGTALALQGAEVLADTLVAAQDGDRADLDGAFARYAAAMRTPVEQAQRMFPGRVAMYAPSTARGILTTALMVRAVQLTPVAAVLMWLARRGGRFPEEDDADLTVTDTRP